jgi:hypothetical protein
MVVAVRTALVLLIALAGCSGAAPERFDARQGTGIDTGVPDSHPADAEIPVCVTPAVKPTGATGTLASGVYPIAWTPIKGELGNLNPLVGTDRLTVDVAAGTARYDHAGCVDCVGTHTGTMVDGCLLVPRGSDGSATRDEYLLCASDTGVIADLTWCGYPGPPAPRTWKVSGPP